MSELPQKTLWVTIGGEAIPVPPVLSFAQLKRAWPAIRALSTATDLVERTEAAIGIVAAPLAAARPELTAAAIADRLLPSEIVGLLGAVPAILHASGLIPEGEAEAASRSTATSTGSPPSSSATASPPPGNGTR